MGNTIRIDLSALGITLTDSTDFTLEFDDGVVEATNPTDATTPIQIKNYDGAFPTLYNLASTMSAAGTITCEGVRISNFLSGTTSAFSFSTDAADYIFTRSLPSTMSASASTSGTAQYNFGLKMNTSASASVSLPKLNVERALASTASAVSTASMALSPYAYTVKYTFTDAAGFNGKTLYPFAQSLPAPNPWAGSVYPITVVWGDGTTQTISNQTQLQAGHTYTTSSTSITVKFTFNDDINVLSGHNWSTEPDKTELLSSEFDIRPRQFFRLTARAGDTQFSTGHLTVPTSGFLPTSVNNLSNALRYTSPTSGRFNQSVNSWNVSRVKDFSYCFQGQQLYNLSVSSWNTEKATTMNSMFSNCQQFNQNVSGFNVSNVVDMREMFANCFNFDGSSYNFSSWDTSNVEDMHGMFLSCPSVPGGISGWDTSSLTNCAQMFSSCKSVGGNLNLSSWDASNITDCSSMFNYTGVPTGGTPITTHQGLASWSIASLTKCNNLFSWVRNVPSSQFDLLIVAWRDYVVANGGPSNVNGTLMFPYYYTPSTAASTAISTLQNTYNWTITIGN